MPFTVLVVDDDKSFGLLLKQILESEGHTVFLETSFDLATAQITEKSFDVVLCDIHLGLYSGFDLFKFAKALQKNTKFIFITGQICVDTAVMANQEGAFEYLSKPDSFTDLKSELLSTLDRLKSRMKNLALIENSYKIDSPLSQNINYKSIKTTELYRKVAQAASFRGNVLIQGETGSGKEVVARDIHRNSMGAQHPFVAINCAALAESVLESELFGHVKGAFTDASINKVGLFEEADGGTLFLDEIGDISKAMQVKLLRAIQEGEIKPVGSSKVKKVNVRIIAASHKSLEDLVKIKRFREDLFYRLKVFFIEVPSLRERKEDIRGFIQYFIQSFSKKFEKTVVGIDTKALETLERYSWPGNIRELENVISRAVVIASSGIIFEDDLPSEIFEGLENPVQESNENILALEEIEKNHIQRVLKLVNYQRGRAAQLLGINRVTLYRKATRYCINLTG
jgi:DNA-binding NtrC family response regulator